jgi:hypothetical protein
MLKRAEANKTNVTHLELQENADSTKLDDYSTEIIRVIV